MLLSARKFLAAAYDYPQKFINKLKKNPNVLKFV
jgi:hypothetical protein